MTVGRGGWWHLVGVGIRTIFTRDRQLFARNLLLVVTIAMAAAGLGVVAAVPEALGHREDRRAARAEIPAPDGVDVAPHSFRMGVRKTRWHGHEVSLRLVTAVDHPDPPPGLATFPRPGELAVSPALQRILQDPAAAPLRQRLGGRPTSTIGPAGLLESGELIAYAGRPASGVSTRTLSLGWGIPALRDQARPPSSLLPLTLLAVVLVLGPLLLLAIAALRIFSERRDRLYASLVLVGTDGARLSGLLLGEALPLVIAGLVLGRLVSGPLAAFSACLLPAGHGLLPTDLIPSLGTVLRNAVVIALVSLAGSLIAIRTVEITPLGVAREATRAGAPKIRLLPLVLGFALLALCVTHRHAIVDDSDAGWLLLLTLSIALVAVGVLLCVPLAAQLTARAATRRISWLPGQLAARGYLHAPEVGARTAVVTSMLVFGAGALQAFFPVLQASASDATSDYLTNMPTQSVVVVGPDRPIVTDHLAGLAGVRDAATVTPALLVDPDHHEYEIVLASCRKLAAVLVSVPPDCGTSAVHTVTPAAGTVPSRRAPPPGAPLQSIVYDREEIRLGEVRLPTTTGEAITLPGALSLNKTYLIDTDRFQFPGLDRIPSGNDTILLRTDGTTATTELIRTWLWDNRALDVATPAEIQADNLAALRFYRRLLLIAVTFAVIVTMMGLVISGAAAALERRRRSAVLWASGMRNSTICLVHVLQLSVATVAGVILAAACAILVGAAYLRLVASPDLHLSGPLFGFDFITLTWFGLAAIAATTLAAAVTVPLTVSALNARSLRSE